MIRMFYLKFYDPEPQYGGGFTFDIRPFFAEDIQSAECVARSQGWGDQIKMVEI